MIKFEPIPFWRACSTPIVATVALFSLFATGCGSSHDPPSDAKAAIAKYRSYLEKNAATLVTTVSHLAFKVKIDYVGSAESRYAYARVSYGQIEPVAESFSRLNRRIDALADEVPASEFGGFHRIERALWLEETAEAMTPVARQLLADVKELQHKIKTVDLQPILIANGASALLDEVSTSAIAGEEERYSHTDMVDISANVEGAEAAFEAVKPLLDEKHSDLAKEVEDQFKKVYATLREYGHPARESDQPWPSEPGIGFYPYEPSQAEIRHPPQPFKALARLFSQVPAQIIS